MRCGYNSVVLLFLVSALFLFSASSAEAATICGGKAFQGDNFTSSVGGIFIVHGTDSYTIYNNSTGYIESYYKTMIITSTIDDTVAIKNGTCKATKKYNYCYTGSIIDMKNVKTFMGDVLQPRMDFYIDSLPSPSALVTLKRDAVTYAYCGQLITIPVIFTNSGSMATNITYTESLPLNTLVTVTTGGNVDGGIITFKDTLWENSSKNYSYTMTNFDCKPKHWNAKYSFTNFNTIISRNITNLSIILLDSYSANDSLSASKTNDPKTTVTYIWNITNTHQSINLMLNFNILTPGLTVTDTSPILTRMDENKYLYSGTLPVGGNLLLYLKFHAINYGNYTILNTGTIGINEHTLAYNSSKTLMIVPPKVITFIDVNNSVNNSLYVNVWARNDDMTEKYYYIYGNLKGIDDNIPLYANNILPDSSILIGTQFYNTTGLGLNNVTFVFDGVYRDKNSMEYKLYANYTTTLNSPHDNKVAKNGNSTMVTKTSQSLGNNSVAGSNKNTTNTKDNSSASSNTGNKDFITRMLEALSQFLQSIFG